MPQNLWKFINYLKEKKELIELTDFWDTNLEISELTDRIVKSASETNKALLFTNNGTKFPVVTNLFGSEKRISWALGYNNLDEISERIESLIKTIFEQPTTIKQKLKLAKTLFDLRKIFPKYKIKGECQQIIEKEPDLEKLPILKTWPEDASKFITLPLVHTIDPITKKRNLGMYRMQVLDKKTTCMHWHKHKGGAAHFEIYKALNKKMPVAVALGGDPVYTYVATAPLPENIDEYFLAGFLRNKPVELVKCITQDIYVPSDADIILEGYIDPNEQLYLEGPFGDHTGFYSEPDYYPIFHITCITYKKNAIYPATVVGIPPQEDYYFALATQKIFTPLIKHIISPEIEQLDLPSSGVAHNFVAVKIKNSYPGSPNKVANAIWGNGQLSFTKFIFITDIDIEKNYLPSLQKALKYFHVEKDVYFNFGPMDVLEHASEYFIYGSKAMFDLTIKNKAEINEKIKLPTSFDKPIINYKSLDDLDLPIIIFSVEKTAPVKFIAEEILKNYKIEGIKIALFVDKNVDINNLYYVSWLVGSNVAPLRDIIKLKNLKNKSVLIIDATSKNPIYDNTNRNWPKMTIMNDEIIEKINLKISKIGLNLQSPSLTFKKWQE